MHLYDLVCEESTVNLYENSKEISIIFVLSTSYLVCSYIQDVPLQHPFLDSVQEHAEDAFPGLVHIRSTNLLKGLNQLLVIRRER
jgi:hypothetical protein